MIRLRTTVVAAMAAACVLLSSCGGSDPDKPAGESLRFQLYQEPTSFNPITVSQGADGQIVSLQFRSLVALRPDGVQGELAESYEVSSDATTYEFKLRKNNWSDGTPFTAADVEFSLQAYLNTSLESPFSGFLTPIVGAAEYAEGKTTSISGLSVPDPSTVVLKITEPNASFLADLENIRILPKSVFEGIDITEMNEDEFFREPTIGMGPYIFSRWVTDDQIEFKANPEFWVDPKLDTVYAQYLTTDVARAQLDTGEINIAQLAPADVKAVEETPGVNVLTAQGNTLMMLLPSIDKGALKDARVRQAMMYAIDRQAILDNLVDGQGTVPATPIFRPDWAQNPSVTPYPYDPERARQLLAEAGWDKSTEVKLGIVPGDQEREALLAIVAGQLQEVGMNAKITTYEPATLSKVIADGSFDTIITILGNTDEPASNNARFTCDQIRPVGINYSGWCDEKLDELLRRGATDIDQDARADAYQQAQKILHDQLPLLPLYVTNTSYGVTEGVTGVDPITLTATAENWGLS